MSRIQGQNVVSTHSPYTYAACRSTVRSPVGLHGMAHPQWLQNYQDPKLTDAVYLNALSGLGCERGQNAPSRDESYFQVVVEQRPVFQLPEETTRESELVPSIWDHQIKGSCGLDIGSTFFLFARFFFSFAFFFLIRRPVVRFERHGFVLRGELPLKNKQNRNKDPLWNSSVRNRKHNAILS